MKKQNNQLRLGILLSYVNMGIGNLIPIFYTPIMLALLGQNEYGLYKLSSSVTSYLSLISMGLGAAITRYLIKAREQEGQEAEERMLGLFVAIFHVIAVLALVIGTILTMNLHVWYANSLSPGELGRMKILVLLMVCNMALGFSQSPYQSLVTSHEKYLFYQCMNFMLTTITPIMNLAALYMGAASVGMAVVSLLITVIVRIAYQIYIRSAMKVKPRFNRMPVHALKEILAFSFWIFVANIVGQLYNATDTVMIGALPALGTAAVAVYNIGNTFNSITLSLTTGISNLLAPKTNKMVFRGASAAELTDLAIRVGRIQGYIMCLIVFGFICFGRPFIHFYAGEGYEASYWVAVLVMIPNMVPLLQSVCLSIITAQNKHKFRSLVYLGIAIANVVGTWFMMQRFGVVGAAFMTGLALLAGNGLVMNWYYSRKIGLEIGRFWRSIGKLLPIPAVLCALTLLVSRFVDFYSLPVLLIGIAAYTAVYALLNWLFVMNEYERDIVRLPLIRLFGKNKH